MSEIDDYSQSEIDDLRTNSEKSDISDMDYGARIAEALRLREKNAFQIAREMGVGRTAIDDIIRGRSRDPRISTLRALADTLDVSLNFLIGETDNPDPDALAQITAAPAASSADQTSGRTLRLRATRMVAAEDVASGWIGASLDLVDEHGQPSGEARLALTYEAAVRGARTLEQAVDRLDAHRRKDVRPFA